MSSTCSIDYFALLGQQGSFEAKKLPGIWQEGDLQTPEVVWNDAIVDIAVVCDGESVPDDSWQLIEASIDGNPLPFSGCSLAIRRRSSFYREDHITEIKLVSAESVLPWGFEIVYRSITGAKIASLGPNIGFIAVKRADPSGSGFVRGEPFYDELCVVLKDSGEEIPEKFHPLEYILTSSTSASSSSSTPPSSSLSTRPRKNSKSNNANKFSVLICCHKRAPQGICDIGYVCSTLDRYPRFDNRSFALPEMELPMFAFPHDLRLKFSSTHRYPMPIFFTFVFTDVKGNHFFVACLRFYEKVPVEEVHKIFRTIFGDKADVEKLPAISFYSPKVICVVSRLPFYRAMRRYLRQLYSMSVSSLPCPLEFYVAAVVGQIPLPVPGGRPFYIIQDMGLISATSKGMAPIIFELPTTRFFPHMDLDFAGPLRCLSVENLLVVFTLLLREEKVAFMCKSHTMLTETMDTLRALLFPLTWSSCFVSRLPISLAGMLGALGGFMIGLQIPEESDSDKDSSVMFDTNFEDHEHESSDEGDESPRDKDKSRDGGKDGSGVNMEHHRRGSEYSRSRRHEWSQYLLKGTYVVDLSSNNILQFDGVVEVPLSPTRISQLLKTLPAGPKKRLENRLEAIAQDYGIGPQPGDFTQFDSAFDFALEPEGGVSPEKWERFPSLEVRDAFMVYMVEIVGNYPRYLLPVSASDPFRTFKETFNVDDYIADSIPSGMKVMSELLTQTQMFSVIIQQWTEATNESLVFFDKAAEIMRELGLCVGGHGYKAYPNSNVPDMPAPLYKLVQAKARENHFVVSSNQYQMQTSRGSSTFGGNFQASRSSQSSSSPVSSSLSRPVSSVYSNMISPTTSKSDNPALDNLLAIIKAIELGDVQASFAAEGANDMLVRRSELDAVDNDLLLYNAKGGPLILPGPIKKDDDTIPHVNEAQIDSDGRYCYNSGWPLLSPVLLDHASNRIHSRLKEIKEVRVHAIEKVDNSTRMMIRPPGERLSFYESEKMYTITKSSTANNETVAVLGSFTDIISICINLLQMRVVRNDKPVGDMLQILGVLSQLEDRDMLDCLDESMWRGILIACRHTGGDFMHKVATVTFDLLSDICMAPDALTCGQFIQALHSTPRNNKKAVEASSATSQQDRIDPFLYLEEIGLTWLMQRAALSDLPTHTATTGTRKSKASKGEILNTNSTGSISSTSSTSSLGSLSSASGSNGNNSQSNSPASRSSQSDMITNSSMWRSMFASSANIRTSTTSQTMNLSGALRGRLPIKVVGAAALVKNQLSIDLALISTAVMPLIHLRKGIQTSPCPLADFPSGFLELVLDLQESLKRRMDTILLNSAPTSRRRSTSTNNANTFANGAGQRRRSTSSSATSITDLSSRSSNLSDAAGSGNGQGDSPIRSRIAAFGNMMGFSSGGKNGSPLPPAPPTSTSAATATAAGKSTDANSNGVRSRQNSRGSLGSSFLTKLSSSSSFSSSSSSSSSSSPSSSSSFSSNDPNSFYSSSDLDNALDLNSNFKVSIRSSDPSPLRPMSLRHLRDKMTDEQFFDEDEEGEPDDDEEGERSFCVTSATMLKSITEVDDEDDMRDDERMNTQNSDSHNGHGMGDVDDDDVHGDMRHDGELASNIDELSSQVATTSMTPTLQIPSINTSSPSPSPSPSTSTSAPISLTLEVPPSPSPSPTKPAHRARTLAEIQQDLIHCFSAKYSHGKVMVGAHSRSPCKECGYCMLDEEIQATWCGLTGWSALSVTHEANPVRDLRTAHLVSCPNCKAFQQPLLHIRCYEDNVASSSAKSTSTSSSSGNDKNTNSLNLLWSEDVQYLSPGGVRHELENLIELIGDEVVDPNVLCHRRSDLYWCILWYASRMNMPSGFLGPSTATPSSPSDSPSAYARKKRADLGDVSNDGPWYGPLFVGWRESIVIRKIEKFFAAHRSSTAASTSSTSTSTSTSISQNLDLSDIFPQCSLEQMSAITTAVHQMDGSLVGMRNALLSVSIEPSLLDASQGGPLIGRNIYINILSLMALFADTMTWKPMLPADAATVATDLNKINRLEKLFCETVTGALSRRDFDLLDTTQDEILSAVPPKGAQTFRLAFGFLL